VPSAERILVEYFELGGYMRVPNDERRKEEPNTYKKGYEVRLVTDTRREIREIRQALRKTGIKGGRVFRKHSQWVQPIYGKESVQAFLNLL